MSVGRSIRAECTGGAKDEARRERIIRDLGGLPESLLSLTYTDFPLEGQSVSAVRRSPRCDPWCFCAQSGAPTHTANSSKLLEYGHGQGCGAYC